MDSQTVKYWGMGLLIFTLGVFVGRELLRAEIRWAVQNVFSGISELADELDDSENQDDSAKWQPNDEALVEYAKWLEDFQEEFKDVLEENQYEYQNR